MPTKRLACLLTCLLLVLTLPACGGKGAASEPEGPNEPAVSVLVPQPEPEPEPVLPYTNPLTGEGCEVDVGARRPIAVMLNNLKKALPQVGVSQADVIYEILAEGGITRMMAVFQDVAGAGEIGTVRSARDYYASLAYGHDAVYLHAGGSPQAYEFIKSRGVTALDCVNGPYEGTLFWRDQERRRSAGLEHSVLTSSETIQELLPTYQRVRLDHEEGFQVGWTFQEGPEAGGEAAEILTVPVSAKDSVYYLYGGSAVPFSLPDLFGGVDTPAGLILGVLLAILLGGCVAALFAWLIGLPVLRLKSDYLAIATLGFAEIIRAVFQWQALGPVTNGANMITQIPSFNNFNLTDGSGKVFLRLSTFFPFLIAILCIIVIVMLINSSYGRAFKAIREDEIAAEAMGINLAKHKMLSFCISSFFAGVGGALFAMFVNNAQAKVYTSTMTYEILLIVVIGGIGSISGSCLATFLYVACAEWWLRFLDSPMTFTSVTDTRRILFILVFAALVIGGALLLIRRERRTTKKVWKELLVSLAALALLVWLAFFIISGSLTVPLLRTGFRMVVFSVIIMIVVLFFRRGIMGAKEFSDILFARRKASGKGAVK